VMLKGGKEKKNRTGREKIQQNLGKFSKLRRETGKYLPETSAKTSPRKGGGKKGGKTTGNGVNEGPILKKKKKKQLRGEGDFKKHTPFMGSRGELNRGKSDAASWMGKGGGVLTQGPTAGRKNDAGKKGQNR